MSSAQFLILAALVIAANLPYFAKRRFFVLPIQAHGKSPFWLLPELLLSFIAVSALSWLLESNAHGGVYAQGWQFYFALLFSFVVLGFPGFVYRFLWRRR